MKKTLNRVTFWLVVILIACTFLSKSIASAAQPKVEVIKPVQMSFTVGDESADGSIEIIKKTPYYDAVIPYSAVITGIADKNYIYTVYERQGLFGREYYVKRLEVTVIDSNDYYAAIGGNVISIYDDVVISSSTFLTSGSAVKVVNQ